MLVPTSPRRANSQQRPAFTLVELLVVIAIIGILVALLLPAVQAAREAGRRTKCKNNLKQLGLALLNYHSAHEVLPPASTYVIGDNTRGRLGLVPRILPFLEQSALYDQIDFRNSLENPDNAALWDIRLEVVLCPSFNNPAYQRRGRFGIDYHGVMGAKAEDCPVPQDTSYTVHALPSDAQRPTCQPHGGYADNGCLYIDSAIRFAHVRDGTSNTLLLGEQSWDVCQHHSWMHGAGQITAVYSARNVYHPINSATYFHVDCGGTAGYNDTSFGSQHPGGTHFVFCDGAIIFLSENIRLETYRALASRAAGEAVGGDFR